MKKNNFKIFNFLVIVSIFFACRPNVIAPEEKSFCEINSTDGSQIDRIEYRVSGLETQVDKHLYNINGLLQAIKDVKYNVISDSFSYDKQNRLIAKISYHSFTLKGGESGALDSLFYDNQNRLFKMTSYRFNYIGGIMINFGTRYYLYDINGEIERDTMNNGNIRSYKWLNGNLVNAQLLTKLGEVVCEQFFKYDDKKNPFPPLIINRKPFSGNILGDIDANSLNNLISSDNKIYIRSGSNTLLTYEYCYNQQGYPTFIKGSRGDSTLIFYKN